MFMPKKTVFVSSSEIVLMQTAKTKVINTKKNKQSGDMHFVRLRFTKNLYFPKTSFKIEFKRREIRRNQIAYFRK